MGLLSFFKRQGDAPKAAAASVGDASDAVQRARTRARQRLIGAIVLLGIGIIGFPLVFETQPRPIPVNIPIEAPPKDGAPALTMPAARASVAASPSDAKPVASAPGAVITESREDAGREVVSAPASTTASAAAPVVAPVVAPLAVPAASKPLPKPAETKPAAKPAAEPKPAADSARAQALLEGKRDTPSDAGRFVVQVGAFADAAAAHETRLKAEKLGMKTYTQVAATSAGNRIRVRLGPFTSRADADKALAKAKGAGMTAVVLTL
jgi:DedD protein